MSFLLYFLNFSNIYFVLNFLFFFFFLILFFVLLVICIYIFLFLFSFFFFVLFFYFSYIYIYIFFKSSVRVIRYRQLHVMNFLNLSFICISKFTFFFFLLALQFGCTNQTGFGK